MAYKIALIPGDGIGREVIPEGVRTIQALAGKFGFEVSFAEFPYSCQHYLDQGVMMPPDGLDALRPFDAILLGAVGAPGVADHVSLWGLLLPIRRTFDQYVSLRPVRLLPGIKTPLAGRRREDIDFVVVRENTEGEYSEIGGRLFAGTEREVVVQETLFSRKGVDRILRYAFELARRRPDRHVTSATKSNGIRYTMPFWDERFEAVSKEYQDIRTDQFHIDILSAHFVMHPDWFDVVVGSNLFGDILSDVAAMLTGSLGMLPSASLAADGKGLYEPVHGSAPDIAGQDKANPLATILSVALMFRHAFSLKEAGELIEKAVYRTLACGFRTPDIPTEGARFVGAEAMGNCVLEQIESISRDGP